MAFTLLPAVDVAGGGAVRLVRGAVASETVGAPLAVAQAWQAAGASWIHLVDVDAAFGRGSNAELLATVVRSLDVRVELAGGVRDEASLQRALASGCARVVVGCEALADPGWCAQVVARHGDRVAVALDVRVVAGSDGSTHHRLAPRGTTGEVGDLWPVVATLDRAGCARYVVTDVDRDGALGGPNVDLYRAVTAATGAPVVASGGVASLDDLRALAAVASSGANLEGAVVGGALHTGRFTLPEALAALG